jgi:hypothetical protein
VSDELEQPNEPDEQPTPASDAGERVRAAAARDEARAAADELELEPGQNPDELSEEQLLELLPAELRAAIDAGEVEAGPVLAATREAVRSGALEGVAGAEPAPDPLLEAREAYLDAVAAVLGPDAEVLTCAHCDGRGFNPRERRPSAHHRRCEECGGEAYVETGSKLETQAELPCEGCGGTGWVRVLVQAEAPPVPIVQPYVPTEPVPVTPYVPPVVPQNAGVVS